MSRFMTAAHARFGFVLLSLLLVMCGAPRTASAWKPKHHISTGNEAIRTILTGQDSVWIEGQACAVPPLVAQAIRNHPAAYRAGCVGPDGFPDLAFGQTVIHPDWKDDGGTYTHEWLAHVYLAGWDYYRAHSGDATGQEALAFTYGFLTHAAGDLWGHTLINSFAGGSWPDIPGGDLNIAIRHIIVESYITEHVPTTDLTIAPPNDFIYSTFIQSDEALRLSSANTTPFGIPYFRKLRASLAAQYNSIDCDWYDPTEWIDCGKRAYIGAWIGDIDSGLRVWPERMSRIGQHWFVDEYPGRMDDGMADLAAFAYDHLLSMYGAPDFIGDFLSGWDAITTWVEGLIGVNIPGVGDLIVYIVERTYGISFDQMKEYFTNPTSYINTPPLFAANTSSRLDALMQTNGAEFDAGRFAANQNTVILAKMVLLDAPVLNSLLARHGVAPLYGDADATTPAGMRENVMLGFIRTLDGDHQWRKTPLDDPARQHGEGLPLWVDCHARDLVFRQLFTDWEQHPVAGNFPDMGEECECLYDLPPTITVTVDRNVLWPPNHKMVTVTATATVRDDCDPSPTFKLLAIWSNEPDDGRGDGSTRDDIQGAACGTADAEFQLRAERDGSGDGRTYTITFAGVDAAGNADTVEVLVRVPRDEPGRVLARGGASPGGRGFGTGGASFSIVVPSATLSGPAQPGVLVLNPSRAFLGNHLGQVPALSTQALDVTGDGVDDVIVEYPVEAVLDLARRSAMEQARMGFRYEDRSGTGFCIPDVSTLGGPLGLSDPGEPARDDRPAVGTAWFSKPTPNPFTGTMNVSYRVPESGSQVRFAVYDLAGREIRRLQDAFQSSGPHTLTWDGRGEIGARARPGMYFIRGSIGEQPLAWRVVLVQ